MTLSFKTEINGKPNYFIEKIWQSIPRSESHACVFQGYCCKHKILFGRKWDFSIDVLFSDSSKVHTIRIDEKDRWKIGNKIHFVINNRTKNRFQFAPVMKVKAIQKIKIDYMGNNPRIRINGELFYCQWSWDMEEHLDNGMLQLANNDGFDSIQDFFDYFNKDFRGKIIHWTDFKY